MSVTNILSVASRRIGAANVPILPTKFELGCNVVNSKFDPTGTLPAEIFAVKVRGEFDITDDINNLAVESELLVSIDIPASRCFRVIFMAPASFTFNNETSDTPKEIVVVAVLDTMLVWALAETMTNAQKNKRKRFLPMCYTFSSEGTNEMV